MKSRFVHVSTVVALATALLVTTISAQSIPQAEVRQSAPVQPETLVLTHVTVIDGKGGRPKQEMTLVISGERIVDLFPTGKKRIPVAATVMNLSGHYVIPGLIDSHYHFIPRTKEESEARRRFAFLGGITAVREMAGDARVSAQLAKEGNDRSVQSPRVYFSALLGGPTLFTDERAQMISKGMTIGEAPWARAIKPDTDIVQAVADAKATGATGLKLYADLSPDTVMRITREAHRQGLQVWSHATIFPSKPSDAVAAGVNVISHSLDLVFELEENPPQTLSKASYRKVSWSSVSIDAPRITALLQRMRKRGTMLDDTIIHTALRILPDIVKTQAEKPESERTPGFANGVENWTFGITRRAHKLGIRLVAGTDFQEQPRRQDFPNIHTELELLVSKCGLTPIEAITTATRNAAVALGIQDSYGTIAKGRMADLVILSADPSADIRNTTKIVYVIKSGKLHKREKVTMPAN